MSDAHDPYNTPPGPGRFDPPQADTAPPATAAPPSEPFVVPRAEVSEPREYETGTGGQQAAEPGNDTADADHRLALASGVSAVPALEPLPATAGNFATPAEQGESDGVSLSERIVDEFVAWLKTLASAAVYATLIVTFGFQVARVEGQSMAPTLEDQDRLIVNKLAYRLGDPQVGDIVMLYYPLDPNKSFVKRVIAKPNDLVKIVDGKVYVNNAPADDSFVPPEYRSHEDFGPQTIEQGYYFVMGDHRNNSSDSRHWGLVPKKYIIGRVQLRWWPVPDARTF